MGTTIIGIVLILVCVILGFLVLIQNPKGGGLAGGMGGLGQQMMVVCSYYGFIMLGYCIFQCW